MLSAAVVGASLWILTETLELLSSRGFTLLSLVLTTLWHPLLALGFWGLHKAQSPGRNRLSLAASAMVIAGLVTFAPVSLMFLASGEASLDVFIDRRPFFAAAGAITAGGAMLFGIAMIRSRTYPRWMAFSLMGGFALAVIRVAGRLPQMLQHVGFTLASLVIIGMALSVMDLRGNPGGASVSRPTSLR